MCGAEAAAHIPGTGSPPLLGHLAVYSSRHRPYTHVRTCAHGGLARAQADEAHEHPLRPARGMRRARLGWCGAELTVRTLTTVAVPTLCCMLTLDVRVFMHADTQLGPCVRWHSASPCSFTTWTLHRSGRAARVLPASLRPRRRRDASQGRPGKVREEAVVS